MRAAIPSLLVAAWTCAQPLPQPGREALQDAYRDWRQTDPALEGDATSAGATLGARADKAAAAAAKYFAMRKTYLENLAADAGQKASAVEALPVAPDGARGTEAYLSAQSAILASSIETLKRASDPGIQRLLQALERERVAIASISAAMKDAQKIQQAVTQASNSAEQARSETSERYSILAAGLRQSSQLAGQFAAAWANYYRMLSDAARAAFSNSPVGSPQLPNTR